MIKTRLDTGDLVITVELANGAFETRVFKYDANQTIEDGKVWCRPTDDLGEAHLNHADALIMFEEERRQCPVGDDAQAR